jgi:hypothetical protein
MGSKNDFYEAIGYGQVRLLTSQWAAEMTDNGIVKRWGGVADLWYLSTPHAQQNLVQPTLSHHFLFTSCGGLHTIQEAPWWWDAATKLWSIPLVAMVRNNNTNTVIVNWPPSEFLPKHPPSTDTIHNVYELKSQPELICYYHTAAGFPKKPTWVKAVCLVARSHS